MNETTDGIIASSVAADARGGGWIAPSVAAEEAMLSVRHMEGLATRSM